MGLNTEMQVKIPRIKKRPNRDRKRVFWDGLEVGWKKEVSIYNLVNRWRGMIEKFLCDFEVVWFRKVDLEVGNDGIYFSWVFELFFCCILIVRFLRI